MEFGSLPPGAWNVTVTTADGRSWTGTTTTSAGAGAVLQLDADEAAQTALADNETLIKRLARIDSITPAANAPKGAITIPTAGATFCLPLADIIDVNAEKRRVQKAMDKLAKEIGGLQGRLKNPNFTASAPPEIVEQARRVQELEGQLASTQAQLLRFNQVDQSLQQLKNELVLMLQRQDEQHSKDLRESERLRAGEREAAARNIAEVRKELPRFSRIEEELQGRSRAGGRLLAGGRAGDGHGREDERRCQGSHT